MKEVDYLIIGSGIIGLTLARTLKLKYPNAKVLIIDKEEREAFHASGRNSGVLHAGFYYTTDSLKAKLTIHGNRAMKHYCKTNGLPVNESGKLVVTKDDDECDVLKELERRGKSNGSQLRLIDEKEAEELEPNVRTHKIALHSPATASIDPIQVCHHMRNELETQGVEFSFQTAYLSHKQRVVETSTGPIDAKLMLNCAGLYADKIARDYGFSKRYTILPFKGLYLKYTKNSTDLKMNIYPVPNIKNPFLGVHFTITVDGKIKIGPTATPAFWRENYSGFSRFNAKEMFEIGWREAKLYTTNAFGFRDLAQEEVKKCQKSYFVRKASELVKSIDPHGFTEWTPPGIRAQLLDTAENKLVQDFVIEADQRSIHILNAVSPAFTCAFPFAEHVVHKFCS